MADNSGRALRSGSRAGDNLLDAVQLRRFFVEFTVGFGHGIGGRNLQLVADLRAALENRVTRQLQNAFRLKVDRSHPERGDELVHTHNLQVAVEVDDINIE